MANQRDEGIDRRHQHDQQGHDARDQADEDFAALLKETNETLGKIC